MDDGFERPPRATPPSQGLRGQRPSRPNSPKNSGNDENRQGGLLSRFSGPDNGPAANQPNQPPQQNRGGPLKRLTDGMLRRVPRAGEWRATDFSPEQLETWDQHDDAPFELPPDPDASPDSPRNNLRNNPRNGGARSRARSVPAGRGGRANAGRNAQWEDDWDVDWETGTWDTGWANDYTSDSMEYAGTGESDVWMPGRQAEYDDDEDALSRGLNTLAQLGAVGRPMSRLMRMRLLLRRRPGAAAVLAIFLLGFMLTCFAPLIPLLRLGYDIADASHRVSTIQSLIGGDPTQLMNSTKLDELQSEVDGIQHDLYEINGVFNVVGAPAGAVSASAENYRLLVRMGYDLTSAADAGIQVAQTVLVPIQGGAVSDSSAPDLTEADITAARQSLATAQVQIADAITAYGQLDQSALPAQLKPGTTYGKMLTLLPTAAQAMTEMNTLMDVAPTLLGVGDPAYYLVIAMDSSELRPGGGFQGNYGILTLQNGKQSTKYPLSLKDTYDLDEKYYQNPQFNSYYTDAGDCHATGPQPPAYYWWWPYRNFSCDYGWGLRDSNLSPDFPTNAQTAMRIVQDADAGTTGTSYEVPNNGQLQGVIAFTPGLITSLLKVTGPLQVGAPYNVTVTADNLEHEIHEFQLGAAGKKVNGDNDRKSFTHVLSSMLLDKVKGMHGSALKAVAKVGQDAIKSKDLQIYFADPSVELILRQLGLASAVATGNGDGFFVVDTNDGGNKSNAYVVDHETDYVTLLPNGGALHRLQIQVTYDKPQKSSVYEGTTGFEDYSDVQRTYLPGDATILGYSGFNPAYYTPSDCQYTGLRYTSIIAGCEQEHSINNQSFPDGVVTTSDIPGRTMVMGNLLVLCGSTDQYPSDSNDETYACTYNPQPHTQTIYITWYTPNAFTLDANGKGTYSMLVERQAGSKVNLTVYVSTAQLGKAQASPTGTTPDLTVSDDATFAQLIKGATRVFNGPLTQNQTITYNIK